MRQLWQLPIGIAARIWALSGTVAFVSLAIFALAIIPQQKADLLESLDSKARGISSSLQETLAGAAVSEDYSSLVEQCIQALAGDEAIEYLVITKNDGFSVIVERRGWRTDTLPAFWHPARRVPSGSIGSLPLFGMRAFHTSRPFDYSNIPWGWIHVGLSLRAYDHSVERIYARTGVLAVICLALSLLASVVYARRLVRPIRNLREVVRRIARGEYSARADSSGKDEVASLARSVNSMADSIVRAQRALMEAKENLESRVAERTRELEEQMEDKARAHAELAEAQQRLIELSRQSGMAEVATGVLHNVGNVLNSVNVSVTVLSGTCRESRAGNVAALARMLEEHGADLPEFLTRDPKGKRVVPYLANLGQFLQRERQGMLEELELLAAHINHIKQIVATQQEYAKYSGLIEEVALAQLAEDAFRIIQPGYRRYEIRLERDFEPVPRILADKHRILQILLNLLRNAQQAIREGANPERAIRVRIGRCEDRVRVEVRDSGTGLAPENLTRVFAHGFTTKKDGHGFGLHSGALAARQMGGALWAESEGLGRGATFILELPCPAARQGQN